MFRRKLSWVGSAIQLDMLKLANPFKISLCFIVKSIFSGFSIISYCAVKSINRIFM